MPTPRYDAATNQYVRTAGAPDVYTANGAIAIRSGVAALAKTSAGVFTLAAPAAGDDGIKLIIVARTAFPHTVTIAEGVSGRGVAFDTITFAAVGDAIELLADNLHWVPVAAPNGAVIS